MIFPDKVEFHGKNTSKCNPITQITEKELPSPHKATSPRPNTHRKPIPKTNSPHPLFPSPISNVAKFFGVCKSAEKLCVEWVQTHGYLACVFNMPIPLCVCLAKAPTKHKAFLLNYAPKKRNAPFTSRNQILYNSSAGGRLRRPPCVTT